MRMYAGLDIGGKRAAICVIDEAGKGVWRGTGDPHPEMIDGALQRFKGSLDKVGLESGPITPHLFRSSDRLSDDLHGRAPRGGRRQKPTDQERQGRRLGAGRDVADRLAFIGCKIACDNDPLRGPFAPNNSWRRFTIAAWTVPPREDQDLAASVAPPVCPCGARRNSSRRSPLRLRTVRAPPHPDAGRSLPAACGRTRWPCAV
jgi:hypothetical protein